MSEQAAEPRFGRPPKGPVTEAVSQFTGYWWLWLVAGIAWIVISAVLLQFDQASVATVGVLVLRGRPLRGAVPRESPHPLPDRGQRALPSPAGGRSPACMVFGSGPRAVQ